MTGGEVVAAMNIRHSTPRIVVAARGLARRVDGIFLSDFEQREIGPDLFRQRLPDRARRPGLETPREPSVQDQFG
jgi:hypothetical protein